MIRTQRSQYLRKKTDIKPPLRFTVKEIFAEAWPEVWTRDADCCRGASRGRAARRFRLDQTTVVDVEEADWTLVKAIATAIGLPYTGSKEETLQMVECKLEEKGYDSPNVQVSITDSEKDSSVLCLQSIAAQGVFLQVGLKRAEEISTEEGSEAEGSERVVGPETEGDVTLAQELELAQEEVSLLTETVGSLNDNVFRLNVRVNELWKANCLFAREFETAIA